MSEKHEETVRLQEEVEEARRKQQEASENLLRATTETVKHTKMAATPAPMGLIEHELVDENDDQHVPNGDVSKSTRLLAGRHPRPRTARHFRSLL